jgi:hypothetical protein
MSLGLRLLVALVVAFLPPLFAGGVGVGAAIVLVMAADSGMRDEATASAALNGVFVCLGLAGLCGFPAAAGVLSPRARKPGFALGGLLLVAGALGAAIATAVYFKAALG